MFDTTFYYNETPEEAESERCRTCYYKDNLEYSKRTGEMPSRSVCTFCLSGDGYVSDSVDPKEFFKDYGEDMVWSN